MKKFRLWFASALVVILTATLVWAGVTNFDSVTTQKTSDDTYNYRGNNSSGTRTFSVDASGNVYIAGTLTNSTTKTVPLPLNSFKIVDASLSGPYAIQALSNSSSPGMLINRKMPTVVFGDQAASVIMTSFSVPQDYSSGGAFRVMASQSTTGVYIDFDVYVNTPGMAAFDSSATGQTPVIVHASALASPTAVTLTPSADFSALIPGAWVSVRIWRDTAAAALGILYIHDVAFSYTSSR